MCVFIVDGIMDNEKFVELCKKVIKYANDYFDKIDGPYVSVTWSYVAQKYLNLEY